MYHIDSVVDADARRQLVVPLIYFWCGAFHIDAPPTLSGAVCGQLATAVLLFAKRRTLSKACHITGSPAEMQMGSAFFFPVFLKATKGIDGVSGAAVCNLSPL